MTDLENQISSDYFDAENSLHEITDGRIQVFVEDEEDVPFWKAIFSLCNVKTTVNPASITSQKRGKEIVLRLANQVGKNMVLAVDSDYDYLLGDSFEKSKLINNSPFIFQTYVYSIENFKSLAEIQYQIILEATLLDNDFFDYKEYLEVYSEIIYELFLYSFLYHKENLKNAENHKKSYQEKENQLSKEELEKWQIENKVISLFTVEQFCKIIELNKFEIGKWKKNFDKIKLQIDKEVEKLPKIEEQELEKLKQNLKAKNVAPETTYLFTKGHKIYDNVVGLCVKEIHRITKSEKLTEIKDNSKDKKEETNQRLKYIKQTRDLDTVRQTHKGYQNHFFIAEIKKDIQFFLNLKND